MGNWRAHLILRTRHFRRHFLEKRGVRAFRCDCILTGAAVALLLIAPLPALAQETAPIAVDATGSAKADSTPASPADENRITLGKLDAADRVIAECMRTLLAENPNRS